MQLYFYNEGFRNAIEQYTLTAAQSLYKKCGYVDEGERRMGEKGELIVMSYQL